MKRKKSNIIPFISKGPRKAKKDSGDILDHGKIGELNYEVYSRGVLHIFDKDLKFKKDCVVFEDELDKLDLENLAEGEETFLEGSGDNDDLIFKKKDGDIQLLLRKKEFGMIEKLRGILKKGKKKKAV